MKLQLGQVKSERMDGRSDARTHACTHAQTPNQKYDRFMYVELTVSRLDNIIAYKLNNVVHRTK